MSQEATCWTLIEGAASGVRQDVEGFVRLYAPVVRSYLRARWRGTALRREVEDAAQEVFVECLKQGGVLERADPARLRSFRAFLLGVVRHVALRAEGRDARRREIQPPTRFDADRLAADDERLSQVFDGAWARALLREAATRHAERARRAGADARRRVELLRLRFQGGRTLREIASLWQADLGAVKRQNARALEEFEAALKEVVTFHKPAAPAAEEMARLAALLR